MYVSVDEISKLHYLVDFEGRQQHVDFTPFLQHLLSLSLEEAQRGTTTIALTKWTYRTHLPPIIQPTKKVRKDFGTSFRSFLKPDRNVVFIMIVYVLIQPIPSKKYSIRSPVLKAKLQFHVLMRSTLNEVNDQAHYPRVCVGKNLNIK